MPGRGRLVRADHGPAGGGLEGRTHRYRLRPHHPERPGHLPRRSDGRAAGGRLPAAHPASGQPSFSPEALARQPFILTRPALARAMPTTCWACSARAACSCAWCRKPTSCRRRSGWSPQGWHHPGAGFGAAPASRRCALPSDRCARLHFAGDHELPRRRSLAIPRRAPSPGSSGRPSCTPLRTVPDTRVARCRPSFAAWQQFQQQCLVNSGIVAGSDRNTPMH